MKFPLAPTLRSVFITTTVNNLVPFFKIAQSAGAGEYIIFPSAEE